MFYDPSDPAMTGMKALIEVALTRGYIITAQGDHGGPICQTPPSATQSSMPSPEHPQNGLANAIVQIRTSPLPSPPQSQESTAGDAVRESEEKTVINGTGSAAAAASASIPMESLANCIDGADLTGKRKSVSPTEPRKRARTRTYTGESGNDTEDHKKYGADRLVLETTPKGTPKDVIYNPKGTAAEGHKAGPRKITEKTDKAYQAADDIRYNGKGMVAPKACDMCMKRGKPEECFVYKPGTNHRALSCEWCQRQKARCSLNTKPRGRQEAKPQGLGAGHGCGNDDMTRARGGAASEMS